MFISLIHRIGMLQINRMLLFTADQGRKIIAGPYPPIETPADSTSDEIGRTPCKQTILHHGKPRIVQAVNLPELVRLGKNYARSHRNRIRRAEGVAKLGSPDDQLHF
jgi:hypothetical protein